MISVLLVDDHPFVRAQIKGLLCGADGIEVVGECADGSEVVGVAAAVRPDVVLMDVQMPVMSGAAATRDLVAAQPSIRVLMLTGSMTPRLVQESVQGGAVGYLLKGGDPTLLLTAIRTVADGGTAWPGNESAGSRSG